MVPSDGRRKLIPKFASIFGCNACYVAPIMQHFYKIDNDTLHTPSPQIVSQVEDPHASHVLSQLSSSCYLAAVLWRAAA
jgi:hypothetical protein